MEKPMINLTRLDGSEFVVNCDLILTLEGTPDTLVTLTNGQQMIVRESVAEVVERTVAYRQRLSRDPGALVATTAGPPREEG
jgi:flagellar protein FlbD